MGCPPTRRRRPRPFPAVRGRGVEIAGTAYGNGKGRSKEAEQQAAREAFESLASDRMVTGTGDAGTDPVPSPPPAD